MNKKEWTLTQIARLLDQPQHKLIYLCEKGVILPDGVDAKGRGSSRRFSARNLFEFMVALKLGEFHIPTKLTTNVLRALRSFDKHLGKSYPMLKLPYSLRIPDSPEVEIILVNGSTLYFSIRKGDKAPTYIGGLNLLNFSENLISTNVETNLSSTEFPIERTESLPTEARIAFFKLNLSQVVKNVPLH